jgi:hypothetical protein
MLAPLLVTEAELDPVPAEPEPVEPEPVDPVPVEPEPVEPEELVFFFFLAAVAVEVLLLEVELAFFFLVLVAEEEDEGEELVLGLELVGALGADPVVEMLPAAVSVLAPFEVNPASVETWVPMA